MANELTQARDSLAVRFEPQTFAELRDFAALVAKSSMVPKAYEGKPDDVLVAFQMGAELGLKPLQALQNIAVINGRPAVWGDAMLAICVSHPECVDVVEWMEGETAFCRVVRRGRSPVDRTFSIDDAKRAGLLEKQGPWKQYRNRMLQLRARGFALRDAFPDALRGILSAEEAHDVEIDVTDRGETVAPRTRADAILGALAKPAAPPTEPPAAAEGESVPASAEASSPPPPAVPDQPKPEGIVLDPKAMQEWFARIDHCETPDALNVVLDEARSAGLSADSKRGIQKRAGQRAKELAGQ